MKIHLVEAQLFHSNRRTDMKKLIIAFRNFANSPPPLKNHGCKNPRRKVAVVNIYISYILYIFFYIIYIFFIFYIYFLYFLYIFFIFYIYIYIFFFLRRRLIFLVLEYADWFMSHFTAPRILRQFIGSYKICGSHGKYICTLRHHYRLSVQCPRLQTFLIFIIRFSVTL